MSRRWKTRRATRRRSAYHSFFEILPPSVYFEQHPEWYSLIKGKREPKQLCLANEEMKAEYIKETLRRLREDTSVDFIQVSQSDWHGYCSCEKCKAMMDEDGGVPSGPYLRFANEVAAALDTKRGRFVAAVRRCDFRCRLQHDCCNLVWQSGVTFVSELHGLGSSINCLGRRVTSFTTRDAKEIAKLLTMVPFWNPAIPK